MNPFATDGQHHHRSLSASNLLNNSVKDSLNTSINCKDLSQTHGVTLALKIENGKPKFVAIPKGGDKPLS